MYNDGGVDIDVIDAPISSRSSYSEPRGYFPPRTTTPDIFNQIASNYVGQGSGLIIPPTPQPDLAARPYRGSTINGGRVIRDSPAINAGRVISDGRVISGDRVISDGPAISADPVINDASAPVSEEAECLGDDIMLETGECVPNVVVNNTLGRIKRSEINNTEDEERYLMESIELYPFLFVDFEILESQINDATDGEFVVTPPPEFHADARPRQCADCSRKSVVQVDRLEPRRVERIIDHQDDIIRAPARPVSIPTRSYEGPRAAPIVVPSDIPQGREVIWGDSRPY